MTSNKASIEKGKKLNWENASTSIECETIIQNNKAALANWEQTHQTIIMMCPPTYFDVVADITLGNEFRIAGAKEFYKNKTAYKRIMQRDWLNFKNVLEAKGAKVVLVEPKQQLYTQVFTADPVQSYTLIDKDKDTNAITLFSHFAHPDRVNEVDEAKKLILYLQNQDEFKSLYSQQKLIQAQHTTEGTGDNLIDPYRGIMISGYGIRNSKDSINELRAHLGIPVYGVQSKAPFFHVDTYISILPNGYVMYAPDVMEEESVAQLETIFFKNSAVLKEKYAIIVTKEDAYNFACNTVTINNELIMQVCSQKLLKRLLSKNIHPCFVGARVANFSGGGLHCMVNKINQPVFC